jgi:Transposase DDE domain group 1
MGPDPLASAIQHHGELNGLVACLVRRALHLAGTPAMLDRIARLRAKARAHAWTLIEDTASGFPWLVIAGKTLTGWVLIDMDAPLVTAHSDTEGAAPTWKKGCGFHPLAAWAANTRECLAMLLRPGNAGSDTFADQRDVLAAAIGQVPARFRRILKISPDWPWKDAFLTCWQRLRLLPAPA